jgi:hypothetical protein
MLVPAREVYVCKCSTEVSPPVEPPAVPVRFREGTEADIERVDRRHHGPEHHADFRARLAGGDAWLLVESDAGRPHGSDIVAYTWLHGGSRARYPTLPGCEIILSAATGYGYDAWTMPELRGRGLRRHGFVAELELLRRRWDKRWEASFFVSYQLEGARRSLAEVGIDIIPLWRVYLRRDRSLGAECLVDDGAVRPAFLEAA